MKPTIQITILIATLAAVANNSNAAVISQWTFNDLTNVTTALQSSGVVSGATVSGIVVNPSQYSAGINALPWGASSPNGDNDGYGFGGDGDQSVMFISRANYFSNTLDTANGGTRPVGFVTTWGNNDNDPNKTTVGNSPLSFTVTADSLTTITLNSLDVSQQGGSAYLVHFQEAGGTPGLQSPDNTGGNTSQTALLTNPVIIGPGQSKTFTINLNSGALDTNHSFNTFTLNGSVTAIPEPSMVAWLPALLGTALLRRRRLQRNQA